MNLPHQKINLVWFKRDLRTTDHASLHQASLSSIPSLLFYCFEPSQQNQEEVSSRHLQFIQQSLDDLRHALERNGHCLYVFQAEIIEVLSLLKQHYQIENLFSHQETGLKSTYDRDLAVNAYCRQYHIRWLEFQNNGILRGLMNREGWTRNWYGYMSEPLINTDLRRLSSVILSADFDGSFQTIKKVKTSDHFQPGGLNQAHTILTSFGHKRAKNYSRHISKPEFSHTSCSRLSPYLAYGNLSVREVYQHVRFQISNRQMASSLHNFSNRLRWHCHFIQKFEMEDRMEFESINRGYDHLPWYQAENILEAWQKGQTGYPLVDACMRCLNATGWINFRMRAMLISFITHLAGQHWKAPAVHLARMFVDFEPGIHYPQVQMQTGLTGINTIRIYNPVKQSIEHDPKGLFIKKWVPELIKVPGNQVHEPWKLTYAEQKWYRCIPGQNYPEPVLNFSEARKKASGLLWGFRKNQMVRQESRRILKKHTIPGKRNA